VVIGHLKNIGYLQLGGSREASKLVTHWTRHNDERP